MEKDDNVYIKHILDAVASIEAYINGKDFSGFKKDEMLCDAVVRKLEIIGEATGRISDEFRKQYQEIPWRSIVGLRNKLIHEYFGVDMQTVWLITQKDLPMLKKALSILN